MSFIPLDELNPRIQEKLTTTCNDLKELNKLSAIITSITDNKHLFEKFNCEITLSHRGKKVI